MKKILKIFKPSGSKGTSLAIVVLLTGMIVALSTPVFAETGGGVVQLELPPEVAQAFMDAGILQKGPDGSPVRTNPPDLDALIDNMDPFFIDDDFSGDDTFDVLSGGAPPTGGEPSDVDSVIDELSIGTPNEFGATFDELRRDALPPPTPTGWHGLLLAIYDFLNVLSGGTPPIGGEPLPPFQQERTQYIAQKGTNSVSVVALRARMESENAGSQLDDFNADVGGDPDYITSNTEDTLTEAGGGTTTTSTTSTTTTTTAEETVTAAEEETTTPSTSCSSGEHFHSGFGCETNH